MNMGVEEDAQPQLYAFRPRAVAVTVTAIVVVLVIALGVLVICETDRRKGQVHMPAGEYYTKWAALAPYNVWVSVNSAPVVRQPFVPLDAFPGHDTLEAQWQTIRSEALASAGASTPMAQNVRSTKRIGDTRWKVVMLFWYGQQFAANQSMCPKTMQLLRELPHVHAAMFSILPPSKEIPIHRGPFRGALRYHLGLVVPQQRDKCFINVDGKNYHWQEGQGQLFDDSYLHFVRNDTNETRIVLFLDVERPLTTQTAAKLNRMIIRSPFPRILSLVNNKQETARQIASSESE